jgi:prephenate dehydrogenase
MHISLHSLTAISSHPLFGSSCSDRSSKIQRLGQWVVRTNNRNESFEEQRAKVGRTLAEVRKDAMRNEKSKKLWLKICVLAFAEYRRSQVPT